MSAYRPTYPEAWLQADEDPPIRLGHYCWIGGGKRSVLSVESPRFQDRGAVVQRIASNVVQLRSWQSRHPVFLNARRVTAPMSLKSGDVIRIGPTKVRYSTVSRPVMQVDQLKIIDWDGFLDALQQAKRNRERRASFLVVRRDGRIAKRSPDAARILAGIFGEGEFGALPDELMDWSQGRGSSSTLVRARNQNYLKLERTSVAPNGVVVLLADLLLWTEHSLKLESVQPAGVTNADYNMVCWLTCGKSDDELEEILGLNTLSLDRMLRSILAKYNVRDRAELLRVFNSRQHPQTPWWVYTQPHPDQDERS